ncbi:MAG: hypothetical protein PWQ82_1350 [Thermosediminibacterales bacterium]|nr:hypothetical protein [Thermosediminibacterales bacterium]MDK2835616.1 hypothetical protein [Thermosediminibacterales bacterium]
MKKLRKIFCLITIVALILSFASGGYAKHSDNKNFKLPKGIGLKIKNAVEPKQNLMVEELEEDEEIDEKEEIEEEKVAEDENIEEEDEDIIEEDEDINEEETEEDEDINKEKVMNKIQEKLMKKLIKMQQKANKEQEKMQEKLYKFQERIQEQTQIANEIQERLQERLEIQQNIFEAIDSIINENIEKEDAEELIGMLEDYVKANHKAKKAYKELGKLYRKIGEKEIKVFVNGRILELDAPPVIKAGRTLVPVRAITESLGAKVSFDPETNKVTVTKDDIEVVLTLGETVALVNGEPVEIDTRPDMRSNRTFVPLRFLNEIFGANVEYDPETHMVIIDEDSENQEEEEATEETTEETIEETEEEAAETPAEETTEETAEQGAEETTEETIEQTPEQITEQTPESSLTTTE